MAENDQFSTYAWDELRLRWERDEITVEQLSGQLMVWIRNLHELLVTREREQERIEQSLVDLDARVQRLE